VLLENDGILPLKGTERILVVGPHADATRVLRGNYSSQLSSPPVSLFDGLRRAMPNAAVTLVPWSPSVTDGDPIPTSALRTPDGQPGLRAEYYDADESMPEEYATFAEYGERSSKVKFKSKPTVTRVEPGIAVRGNEFAELSDYYRIVWTGFVVPPESGLYRIGLSGPNAELIVDGKVIAQHRHQPWGTRSEMVTLELEKGRRYPLRVTTDALLLAGVEVLWKRVSAQPEAELRAAAAQADVIVVAVGLTSDLEGEQMKVELEGFSGGDKTTIDIPADQRELLEQVKASGRPFVVVLMNGSTLDLSWPKRHASALIEAWYAGQAGGLAIANVIAGKANPAGRLPLTFYRSVADLPPFEDYSMRGRTYRYFEGSAVYPFGYGLSYSTFEYGPLKIVPVGGAAERGLRVSTTVRNTSKLAGEEVAQLYLDPPGFEGAPRLALRGFQRFELQPGEQRTITFELSPRDLSFVDRDGVRQVFAGEHVVSVGSGQPGMDVPTKAASFAIAREVRLPR
jgi:beta-glucosidase